MTLALRSHAIVDHNHAITLQAPELRPMGLPGTVLRNGSAEKSVIGTCASCGYLTFRTQAVQNNIVPPNVKILRSQRLQPMDTAL